jgi:uncharacterized phage protein (TIGR01671 family)
MREIKFRAWDKKENKWIDGAYGFHILGENMLIGGLFQDYCVERLNDIILMQYTGLKDRNGREIYEGDIVKDQNGLISVIVWDSQDCKFDNTDVGDYWRFLEEGIVEPACYAESVFVTQEVIGNIHQNPELLETK